MKIHGKSLPVRSEKLVTFVRLSIGPGGEEIEHDVNFKITTCDVGKFSEIYPEPTPPSILMAGESASRPDLSDPDYKKAVETRNAAFYNFIRIYSMIETEGLVFEKVDPLKPETYALLHDELRDAGLSPLEILELEKAILEVNNISEDLMKRARERFRLVRST